MELSIQYKKDLGIVETVATGEINTENIYDAGHQSFEYSKKMNCLNLLVDIRKCTVTRSKMEAFLDMEKFMELTGLGYQYRCAVIFNPETYPVDRALFIETVVRNRPNPRFRMFSNRDEALKWLKENE
ncbi:MAG: hypothetical protein JW801_13230 [Bacteroidales bacterium]|nr:hypothetical protein [Bacteroidales bacterium]